LCKIIRPAAGDIERAIHTINLKKNAFDEAGIRRGPKSDRRVNHARKRSFPFVVF
jgi:hypothetical protein